MYNPIFVHKVTPPLLYIRLGGGYCHIYIYSYIFMLFTITETITSNALQKNIALWFTNLRFDLLFTKPFLLYSCIFATSPPNMRVGNIYYPNRRRHWCLETWPSTPVEGHVMSSAYVAELDMPVVMQARNDDLALRIQTPPDRIGLRVPIPSLE